MTSLPYSVVFRYSEDLASPDELVLQCPRCRSLTGAIPRSRVTEKGSLICPSCLFVLELNSGIWNGVTAEGDAHFGRFIRDYETIRAVEGRGSSDLAFYLELPDKDISGKNEAQWKIRRQTFACLDTEIIGPLSKNIGHALDVLDLGAGNGWLSYRLALRGHRPVAVDLITNDLDGLGAARHFRTRLPNLFPRVRADFQNLPFKDRQFDVAIFNASFHYSENYGQTIAESLRCLRRPAWIVIADTAWYGNQLSGEAMLKERANAFTARFGTPSNALHSLEFLTDKRLNSLEKQFGLRWQQFDPGYGIRWRLRPLVAKLRGRRAPSRFRIYVAEVGE